MKKLIIVLSIFMLCGCLTDEQIRAVAYTRYKPFNQYMELSTTVTSVTTTPNPFFKQANIKTYNAALNRCEERWILVKWSAYKVDELAIHMDTLIAHFTGNCNF